jgi:hypothetical protein
MPKKKNPVQRDESLNPSSHWVINEEWTAHGRNLVKGTELSIRGERGRFLFIRHVYNPRLDVEWIDVVGGAKGAKQFRSFAPVRIKTVHWKNKLRPSKIPKEDVK